jgi:hypothetical protein
MKWLSWVSHNKAVSLDELPIPDGDYEGYKSYIEIAARNEGPKTVLAWTPNDYAGLGAAERGVIVLDRDQAREEVLKWAVKKADVNVEGDMVRDKYDTTGVTGAVGPGARGKVKNVQAQNFKQGWQEIEKDGVDFQQLAVELGKLREAMSGRASSPEQQADLSLVEAAKNSAQGQDGPKVLALLSKTGKWVFDVATTIGTTVAAAVLKKALGLP